MVREYTNMLLEECEYMGPSDLKRIINMLVNWMSEDDVKECMRANDFF